MGPSLVSAIGTLSEEGSGSADNARLDEDDDTASEADRWRLRGAGEASEDMVQSGWRVQEDGEQG